MNRVPFRLMPWLRVFSSQTTYNQATQMYHGGHISQRQYDWYRLIWTWGASRFSDVENANLKQNRFASKLGYPALERRFKRIAALRKKLLRSIFNEYQLLAGN